MEQAISTLTLELKNFMPPDCPCKVENHVKKRLPVLEVSINPVTDVLIVKYDKEKVSADQ